MVFFYTASESTGVAIGGWVTALIFLIILVIQCIVLVLALPLFRNPHTNDGERQPLLSRIWNKYH